MYRILTRIVALSIIFTHLATITLRDVSFAGVIPNLPAVVPVRALLPTPYYTYHPQTLRLASFITEAPGGRVQDFSYSFDNAGNVTSLVDYRNSATQSFAYDPLNRLTNPRRFPTQSGNCPFKTSSHPRDELYFLSRVPFPDDCSRDSLRPT